MPSDSAPAGHTVDIAAGTDATADGGSDWTRNADRDSGADSRSVPRRELLASLSAAGAAALAGCSGVFDSNSDSGSGSESGSGACRTAVTRQGDATLIEDAVVRLDDEAAVLRLTLAEGVAAEGIVDWVDVDGEREVPVVEDRREYWLRLGQRPIHDRLTLTAMSGSPSASPVDRLVVEFNCFAAG